MILTEKTSEIKHTQLTPDGDSFRMRVPVLQSDQPNLNKRTYPLAVVKAAIEDLKVKLQKRTAFGSTKHEKDLEVDAVSRRDQVLLGLVLQCHALDFKQGLG